MNTPHGALAGLTPRKRAVALELVYAVLEHVPARLVHAAVFGSTARGEARICSDVDVLLIFSRLAADREPHASLAEEIAGRISLISGVIVEPWTVSLPDLHRGRRTPMLVDALSDALPLWPTGTLIPRLPFTPEDAHFCVRMLLRRVREGGRGATQLAGAGDQGAAARRIRDDLVRLSVAALLLRRETRPRRAWAVRSFAGSYSTPTAWRPVLAWAAASFGPDGKDEHRQVTAPPGGLPQAAHVVGTLAVWLERETLSARRV